MSKNQFRLWSVDFLPGKIGRSQTASIGLAVLVPILSLLLARVFVDSQFGLGEVLLKWDAVWYQRIAVDGYGPWETQGGSAFFPLFPYTWKALGVSISAIVIFNAVMTGLGTWYLIDSFKMKRIVLVLFMSLPTSLFLVLPYSEAIFFLGGAMLLAGLNSKINSRAILGVSIMGLTRPSALFLIVPLALIWILHRKNKTDDSVQYVALAIRIASCFLLVLLLQFWHTDNFYSFFESQSKWKQLSASFSWPLYQGSDFPVRMDVASAIFSLFSLLGIIMNRKKILGKELASSEAMLTSVLFVFTVVLVIVSSRGDLVSSSRIAFCTPFGLIVLIRLGHGIHLKSEWIAFSVLLISVLTVVGFWSSWSVALWYIVLAVGMMSTLWALNKYNWAIYCVTGLMILLQIRAAYLFLSGHWLA